MALNWSDKRRLLIIGGAAFFALVVISGLAFSFLYKPPNCTDGKQNGVETGIDCGGTCVYVCNAVVEEPRITFARTVTTGDRTDVIAYIENRNQDAEAKAAAYTVEVFDEAGRLIGSKKGTVDLPARSVVPVFVPSLLPGVAFTPRAFVSFDEGIAWRLPRERQAEAVVSNVVLLAGTSPRVTATITNPSATVMSDRTVLATVFDADGFAIAASRTTIQALAPRAGATAVFTWPEAFRGQALKVEVRVAPVLP